MIEELIRLAKDMREAERRGEELGLSQDESAFYEALEVNDSAVAVLGDDTLKTIARELVASVKQNATIDWTQKQSVQAKLRVTRNARWLFAFRLTNRAPLESRRLHTVRSAARIDRHAR